MVPREPRDEGVSPVVGMILVLGISVVGIAAILYWGLPAIDEMKANVEHRSAESQFAELDATIKELVAGTTERTAKRWQPTLNRGYVAVVPEAEAWVYATELKTGDGSSFGWIGFDGDATFVLWNLGAATESGLEIDADRVSTTTVVDALNVYTDAGGATEAENVEIDPGEGQTLYLRDEANAVMPIVGETIRFQVFQGGSIIAEAWYIPTGRVDFELAAGLGTRAVVQNNGAVITGNGESFALTNSPPLPPISMAGTVPRFFARAVVLEGSASFAGDDRFDLLVTLDSTATLASYDCADGTDCVTSARIFIFGDLRDTWFSYLTNEARNYEYTLEEIADPDGLPATDDAVPYIEQTEAEMGFTLLQSKITLSTGGG